MTALPPTPQGPAPARPPIPALPSAPGAATGGGGDAATIARDIARDIRDAQKSGPDAFTTSTGLPFDPQAIVREAVPIVGMTLAMVVVIFVGWPIARAYARRLDRRTELGTVRAADLQPQIRQLQESLDTMAVELERISESQRFQAKLMVERPQALPVEPKRA